MDEVLSQPGTVHPARRLARLFETIHSVSYYCREIGQMNDHGFRGWWHAYFGYRAAPLGPVPANVVTALFYNFAPRMVERAVPDVWNILPPAEILARRNELVAQSIRRTLGDAVSSPDMARAAELAHAAIAEARVEGRALFAAHAALPWPDEPELQLWHASMLLREHRGDSHAIALSAAEVDGIECHVLMSAQGFGNPPTIRGIRGYTEDEWEHAVDRLATRGWVLPDGAYTDAGRAARVAIERHTDALAAAPPNRLGPQRTDEFVRLLEHFVAIIIAGGEVAGVWPPPNVRKAAT